MARIKKILGVFLGIMIIALAVIMFVHDSSFILTGKTVDLNQILENNEELPRDKYVTYTCTFPIGNYAETKQTLNGIIPLPFKSQEYAILCENGMVISTEISKKSKIREMDAAVDKVYNGEEVSVELKGCLEIISSDMSKFLEESFGTENDNANFQLTNFVIDTTETRLNITFLYVFVFLIGLALTVGSIIRLRSAS